MFYTIGKDYLLNYIGRITELNQYIIKTKNRTPYHTLKGKLYLADNYIAKQKLRFSNNFDYINKIDNITATNIKVIVMQVLIRIKNAIEHRLQNRKKVLLLK